MTKQTDFQKETNPNEYLLFQPIKKKRKKYPIIIIAIIILLIISIGVIIIFKPFNALLDVEKEDSENESIGNLFRQDLLAVELNEEWGYIDKDGKYVIEPQFSWAYNFSDAGLACVSIGNSYVAGGAKYGYIDTNGKWVINPQFDDARPFGKYRLACVEYEGKYGYIDLEGNWIINPQFENAEPFSEDGLACVRLNDKYGFIDNEGKYVIPLKYDRARGFYNGYAAVEYNNKCGYIDVNDNLIIETEADYWDMGSFNKNGLAGIKNSNGKYGIIDTKGNYVIEPKFDMIGSFSSDGLMPVLSDKKWGIADKTGKIITEIPYEFLSNFSKNGLAAVVLYTDEANEYGEHYLGKYGYVDQSGDLIIDLMFDFDYYCGVDASFFDDGYAVVCLGKYFGIINSDGEYIVNPQFSYVQLY